MNVGGIFKSIVFANIWVALAAPALLAANYLQQQKSVNLYLCSLLFFGVLLVYNLQRLFESSGKELDLNSERRIWISNNRDILKSLASLALAMIFLLTFLLPFRIFYSLIPPTILTILYTIPFIGFGNKKLRLRQITGLKVFLVGLVWSYCCTLLPAFINEFSFNDLNLWINFVALFLFCTAITLPFDLRDTETDRMEGIKTLPQIIGSKKLLQICVLFMIAELIFRFVQWQFLKGISAPTFIAFVFVNVISIYFILKADEKKPELFFTGLLDGLIFLRFLVILASVTIF